MTKVKNMKKIFSILLIFTIIMPFLCQSNDNPDGMPDNVLERKILSSTNDMPPNFRSLKSILEATKKELKTLTEEDQYAVKILKLLVEREIFEENQVKKTRFCLKAPNEIELEKLINMSAEGWKFCLKQDNVLFELMEKSKQKFFQTEPSNYTEAIHQLTEISKGAVIFALNEIINKIENLAQTTQETEAPVPTPTQNLNFFKDLLRQFDEINGFFYHLQRLNIVNDITDRARKTRLERTMRKNEIFNEVAAKVYETLRNEENSDRKLAAMAQFNSWLLFLEISEWPLFLHYNLAHAFEPFTNGITPTFKVLYEERIKAAKLKDEEEREKKFEKIRQENEAWEKQSQQENREADERLAKLNLSKKFEKFPKAIKLENIHKVPPKQENKEIQVDPEPLPDLPEIKTPQSTASSKESVREKLRRQVAEQIIKQREESTPEPLPELSKEESIRSSKPISVKSLLSMPVQEIGEEAAFKLPQSRTIKPIFLEKEKIKDIEKIKEEEEKRKRFLELENRLKLEGKFRKKAPMTPPEEPSADTKGTEAATRRPFLPPLDLRQAIK